MDARTRTALALLCVGVTAMVTGSALVSPEAVLWTIGGLALVLGIAVGYDGGGE